MHLLDINVWLGLAFKRHQHHASAIAWFNSIGQARCCFCRLTQMGFLRLASNPQAMGNAAVTLQQAWQAYDALFADPRVGYVEEPAGIDPAWRSLTQHQSFSPKVWNDLGVLIGTGQCVGTAQQVFEPGELPVVVLALQASEAADGIGVLGARLTSHVELDEIAVD